MERMLRFGRLCGLGLLLLFLGVGEGFGQLTIFSTTAQSGNACVRQEVLVLGNDLNVPSPVVYTVLVGTYSGGYNFGFMPRTATGQGGAPDSLWVTIPNSTPRGLNYIKVSKAASAGTIIPPEVDSIGVNIYPRYTVSSLLGYCTESGRYDTLIIDPPITGYPYDLRFRLENGNTFINSLFGYFSVSPFAAGETSISYYNVGCRDLNFDTLHFDIVDSNQVVLAYPNSVCVSTGGPVSPLFPLRPGSYSSPQISPNNISGNGAILNLGAIAPGTYTITYEPDVDPCDITRSFDITFLEEEDGSFSFPGNPYCREDSLIIPERADTSFKGRFFVPPGSNLVLLNDSTGEIDVIASLDSAGGNLNDTLFFITNGPCPDIEYAVLIVDDLIAHFELIDEVCRNTFGPVYAYNVGSEGGFSKNGSSINFCTSPEDSLFLFDSSDLDSNTAVDIVFTAGGACPGTYTETIYAREEAQVAYSDTFFCSDPPRSEAPGITNGPVSFSVLGPLSSGSSFSPTDGSFTIGTPGIGISTVSWQDVECPVVTEVLNIEIKAPFPSPDLIYPVGPFCEDDTSGILPITVDPSGGVFSVVGQVDLDTISGAIVPSASSTGAFSIIYDPPRQECATQQTEQISIDTVPFASFYYENPIVQRDTICFKDNDAPASFSGAGGGAFSSANATGLIVDPLSGQIDIVASLAQGSALHTVQYVSPGQCPAVVRRDIRIDRTTAEFEVDTVICISDAANIVVDQIQNNGVLTVRAGGQTILSSANFNGASVMNVDLSANGRGTYLFEYQATSAIGFNDCNDIVQKTVEVRGYDNIPLTYPQSSLCIVDSMFPMPIAISPIGDFVSIPSGLNINPTTGEIDPDSSNANRSYTIQFSYLDPLCPSDFFVTSPVSITPLAQVNIDYGDTAFCEEDAFLVNPQSASQFNGGTFSSVSSGIQFVGTGGFDPSNTPVGDYTVVYTPNSGVCKASDTLEIEILEQDSAYFEFPDSIFCKFDTLAIPAILGDSGGTFSMQISSQAGFLQNTGTGEINLNAVFASLQNGVPITLPIEYETSGRCVNTFADEIVVQNSSADFTFPTFACYEETAPPLVASGISDAGTFNMLNGLVPIQGSTSNQFGNIQVQLVQLDQNEPGTYQLTYETTGACADVSDTLVFTIGGFKNDSVQYAVDEICETNNSPQSPTLTTLGGTFNYYTISGGGISMTLSGPGAGTYSGGVGSNPGSYLPYYILTDGSCTDTFVSLDTIQIIPVIPDTLNYPSTTYCEGSGLSDSGLVGVPGGYFFVQGGVGGIVVDSVNGKVDLDNSDGGTYSIVYQPTTGCRAQTDPFSLMVVEHNVDIHYPQSEICEGDPSMFPVIDTLLLGQGANGGGYVVSQNMTWDTLQGQNASAGAFNPDNYPASTVPYQLGYYIDHPDCPETFLIQPPLTVTSQPEPAFFYPSDSFCIAGIDPVPLFISDTNGVFTSSSLVIDSAGTIDLDQSGDGSHQVLFSVTENGCTGDTLGEVVIQVMEDSFFDYPSGDLCQAGVEFPDSFPGSNGTYSSSTLGADLLQTGEIRLYAVDTGYHVIFYQTSGRCSTTHSDTIRVIGGESAYIEYPRIYYCETDTQLVFPDTLSGQAIGVFSANPSGLAIDPGSGMVNIAGSSPGSYSVTHDISGVSQCAVDTSVTLIIEEYNDDLDINYLDTAYCQSGSSVLPSTISDSGGTFYPWNTNLIMNSSTGEINLNFSEPGGPYFIQYILESSVCREADFDTVYVQGEENAAFYYPDTNLQGRICQGAGILLPELADPNVIQDEFILLSGTGVTLDTNSGALMISDSCFGDIIISRRTFQGCAASEVFELFVWRLPTISNVLEDAFVCQDSVFEIEVGTSDEVAFLVNGMSVPVPDPDFPRSFVKNDLLPGDDLSIQVTDTLSGCVNEYEVPIQVRPNPTLEITSRPEALANGESAEIILDSDVPSTIFMWTAETIGTIELDRYADMTMGELPATIQSEITLNSDYSPGQLTYTIVPEANNCRGEPDTLVINVNPGDHPIFIPGIITPNGNGQNDTWLIQWEDDIDPYQYRLVLFNRGGGKVMEMSPLHNQWGGENLPDGLYRWVLMNAKDEVELAGGLTLRRK